MSTKRLFTLTLLLALTGVAGTALNNYTDIITRSPSSSPAPYLAAEETPGCVAASFAGQPRVNGLGDIGIAAFPGSRRLSYADAGTSQYVAKATPDEVLEFYQDRMRTGCWQASTQRHSEVAFVKENVAVRLALLDNPVSGKTIINYYTGGPEVLGEFSVFMAQTSCSEGQVSCTSSSGGNWCQMPPCPSSTPPPSSTTCSGSYQQAGSTYPNCNYSTCPSGCSWGSDGCPSGCMSSSTPPPSTGSGTCTGGQVWCSSTSGSGGWCQMPPCPSSTPPPSSTTCSGSYQQAGSTYPNCNYSTCPSGCTWSNGCPNGCYTPATCTGEYQQSGSSYPMCNYSKCPNGCNYGSDGCPASCYASSGSGSCPSGYQWCSSSNICIVSGSPCGGSASMCPSGQYWCGSTNSCKPTSDTNCPTSGGGGSGCPSGQYWCNGGCVSTSTSCSSYMMSCPSNQYWCNSACISMGSYCSPSGGTAAGNQSTCTASGGLWCQPNTAPHCHYGPNPSLCESDTPGGNYSSCPSGQYMCNGACVPSVSTCAPTQWPSDSASCASSGKYWCTPQSGGAGWCQYSPCGNTASTPSCSGSTYYCPSTSSCISTGSSCGSSNMPSSNTAPQPVVQCGQCKMAQGNSCVQAPVGTLDPLCNGGQCDQYGGCVNLSGGKKLVGRGAICGDGWCNTEKGEDRGNCPAECTNAQVQTVVPQQANTITQPSYPTQYPQGQYPQGQYPGQYGQNEGQYPQGGLRNFGPSEEDMERMRKEQFVMMKKGIRQFTRGVDQMRRFVQRLKPRLARQGVGIPPELENALAKAPELVKKFEAVQSFEEVEALMEDMQDIGMAMQEWGPRLGELEQLAGMLTRADKDVKNMYRAFKRLQTAAKRRQELLDPVRELEGMVGALTKVVAEAKGLAKTDPESAMDKVQEFYDSTEEVWNLVSLMDMVQNLQKGLTQARSELAAGDRRVRTLERSGTADPSVIEDLKAALNEIRETLPELQALVKAKPVDYEVVRDAAEAFWEKIKEFENMMAEQGQSFYVPTVKQGAGLEVDIPEGFISTVPQSASSPMEELAP